MLSPLRNRAGRPLREPFGKAGLTVGVIALVFAMLGGAYAAGTLTAKQKKEVTKIAKKYAGKDGATGPQGPQGLQGPKGDPGVKGDTGPQGAPGVAGTNGTNGTNGTDGEDGACSLSRPECVLPAGATEAGLWSFIEKDAFLEFVTINYPLKLEVGPGFNWVPFGTSDPDCPGTYQDPKAEPGQLCVYGNTLTNAGSGPTGGFAGEYTSDKRLGWTLEFTTSGEGFGWGSWAVTAAE